MNCIAWRSVVQSTASLRRGRVTSAATPRKADKSGGFQRRREKFAGRRRLAQPDDDVESMIGLEPLEPLDSATARVIPSTVSHVAS